MDESENTFPMDIYAETPRLVRGTSSRRATWS